MAFLTDLDSRAAIKGSRDPLATQSIWVPLGRKIVGNLSTVSTSVRDFTVLMLGFWLIERAVEQGADEPEVSLFLKWEQLAGYVRVEHKLGAFRGVDRARANRAQGSKLTLSADRAHQILSNQKIYGLWGLYTVPGRSSGLLADDPLRLTPRAREFVERMYLPVLSKAGFRDGNALVKLLLARTARIDLEGKDAALGKALASILRADRMTVAERTFYDDVLVQGGPGDDTEGRQRRLAALLFETVDDEDFAFSPQTMDELAKAAGDRDEAGSLAMRLERIRYCESMLAPAARLFGYLLARDGKRPEEIADEVRETWGTGLGHLNLPRIAELRDELTLILGGAEGAERWLAIAGDLRHGRYEDVVLRLIQHNKVVMQQRGGAAPWVELRQGRLHVAFRDEDGELTEKKSLPSLWRSSYFLDALRSVVAQVRRTAS